MVRNSLHVLCLSLSLACGSGEVLLPVSGSEMEPGTSADGESDGEADGQSSDDNSGGDGSAQPPDTGDGSPEGEDGLTETTVMVDATPTGPASDIADVRGGDYQVGDAPAPSTEAAAPVIVSVMAPPAVTNGGSATLLVTLESPVESPRFVVALAGDNGFHTVTGADSNLDGVYEIDLQVSGDATQSSLVIAVAAADAAGNAGEYHEVTVELVQSGVGDVKITLSFDRTHDLDLHVFEPMGEEISFMNPAAANGGQLDLDSGANCDASTALSENVFWPSGQAPNGSYRITVHNYEECTPGDIHYSVRVAYDDQVTVYRGTFAAGTAGSVAEVATFTR